MNGEETYSLKESLYYLASANQEDDCTVLHGQCEKRHSHQRIQTKNKTIMILVKPFNWRDLLEKSGQLSEFYIKLHETPLIELIGAEACVDLPKN